MGKTGPEQQSNAGEAPMSLVIAAHLPFLYCNFAIDTLLRRLSPEDTGRNLLFNLRACEHDYPGFQRALSAYRQRTERHSIHPPQQVLDFIEKVKPAALGLAVFLPFAFLQQGESSAALGVALGSGSLYIAHTEIANRFHTELDAMLLRFTQENY